MEHIAWTDFEKVDLRVGTIVGAKEFPDRIQVIRMPLWTRALSKTGQTVIGPQKVIAGS